MGLATGGKSSGDLFQAVDLAMLMNRAWGTQIYPWEVDQVPDEWIRVLINKSIAVPKMQDVMARTKKIKDKIIAGHKQYKPNTRRL